MGNHGINVDQWVNGEIDRNGRDTRGTDYEQMLTTRYQQGIGAWEDNDQGFIGMSPMDPYERQTAQLLDAAGKDCSTSVGGISGKNFDPLGVWRANCRIFEPVI